ncbi:MAG: glycine--tRNA ligase [Candidatus Diapherotrites archaeon]|nr:glycine--tRNA ligase [Candidatus Diapherotrites archaeon]
MGHYETLQELLLKRAIVYPNSEPHGPVAGFYDYGSVGSEIKRRLEGEWRSFFLSLGDNFHEIDSCLIMPQSVFKASGHLEHFKDPAAVCGKCGTKRKADELMEEALGEKFEGLSAQELDELIKKHKLVCPKCKSKFKGIEPFTLMFPLEAGAAENKAAVYLRPETAQGPFTAFKREFRANRERLPLGLAIIGKAFRNEISPRQLTIRTREFTQAELQIFFDPKAAPEVDYKSIKKKKVLFALPGKKEKSMAIDEVKKATKMPEFMLYYLAKDWEWMEYLGLGKCLRLAQLSEEEKAFYNKYHLDLEIKMPSFDKWVEVAGFHYRTDHDLKGHQKVSGQKMLVPGKDYNPHVLELSFGVDRLVFALLDTSLKEGKEGWYFALPPRLAPFDAGVYPLVNKESLPEKARAILQTLRGDGIKVFFDGGGSIGRRYARADEIGVPFGITIDFDSLKDKSVTVRDRDTQKQDRVKISDLSGYLWKRKSV